MNPQGVSVGVIGAGYWGPNLIRNCAALGILDSVCDVNREALDSAKSLYPSVVTTAQVSELLARPINAVVIAAPAQLHAELALKSLTAGKHVFVEKPLALKVEDGIKVDMAAKAANLQVFVGHLLLYHPAVAKLRSLIAENAIGEVWHIRCRRLGLGKLRAHESVWWSFAPHDIAFVLALMGDEPVQATAAQTSWRSPGICDVAYADFSFAGGRSAHVEVCWLDPHKSARIDVFGKRGVLTLEDRRGLTTLTLTSAGPEERGLGVWRGETRTIDFENGEPLRAELEAFVNSVATGVRPETDAAEGVAVLRALTMADESAKVNHFQTEVPA